MKQKTRMYSENTRLPPDGDTRLTINIRKEVHLLLKLAALHRGETVGDIIEELVTEHITANVSSGNPNNGTRAAMREARAKGRG